MKTAMTLALAAAVLVATPALANTHEGMKDGKNWEAKWEAKMDSHIKKLDDNGDGRISRAEMSRHGDIMFDEADANKDGDLSRAEITAAKQKEYGDMGWKQEPNPKGSTSTEKTNTQRNPDSNNN